LLVKTKKKLELKKILTVDIDKDKKITTLQVDPKTLSTRFSDAPPDPDANISAVSN
jgi:hypothetical protein